MAGPRCLWISQIASLPMVHWEVGLVGFSIFRGWGDEGHREVARLTVGLQMLK